MAPKLDWTRVRAVALDFDGVLTDGTLTMNSDGCDCKTVSYRDRSGIWSLKDSGRQVLIVSAASQPSSIAIAQRYAATFDIEYCVCARPDKDVAVQEFSDAYGIPMDSICFVGDDTADVAAMLACGYSACPSDAHKSAKDAAKLVLKAAGGKGAVRELADMILT